MKFQSLNTEADAPNDAYNISFLRTSRPSEPERNTSRSILCLAVSTALLCLASIAISIIALSFSIQQQNQAASCCSDGSTSVNPPATFVPVQRIAFGSCTSYDLRPQHIWKSVVASKPDAWIWLGDMAYLDNPAVDCNQVPNSPQCKCDYTYLSRPPYMCFAGNVDHARERFMHQVSIPEYVDFLNYMCPKALGSPPQGSDAASCPRPILGTYDDHDSGWNNGNSRLPNKHLIKNLYLDAIGEGPASPRRNSARGLHWLTTLPGRPGSSSSAAGKAIRDEVDVVLLDERYYRDTLPCHVRRPWCEKVLSKGNASDPGAYAWCHDFLVDDGGLTGRGSCCERDERLAAWCTQAGSSSHPLWAAACDPLSEAYGMTPLVLSPDNSTLMEVSEQMYDSQQAALWPWLDASSPICDVLGPPQRRWLRSALSASDAALKIIASGSVLLGGVGNSPEEQGPCGGDDWECYRPAQVNLIHTLAKAPRSGCVLVLTGDFHFADIKLLKPGPNTAYAPILSTSGLKRPIWQFMASGMSNSTAHNKDLSCPGTWVEDVVGLRPLGKCSFVAQPNFGVVEIDWDARVVSLQVRDGSSGQVAVGYDSRLQQITFSLDTCLPT